MRSAIEIMPDGSTIIHYDYVSRYPDSLRKSKTGAPNNKETAEFQSDDSWFYDEVERSK